LSAGRPLSPRVANRLRRKFGRPYTWFSERIGFDTAPRDFYSPIPDLRHMPDAAWREPTGLGGIDLDLEGQFSFLEGDLAPFLSEFRPPLQADRDSTEFFLQNASYEAVDAETLYSMVRFFRPKRIVELGSGRSTQVIALARSRNLEDDIQSTHRVVDPYPTEMTKGGAAGAFDLDQVSVTDVPVTAFEVLEEDDILFVDTTHTVKFGSDVNYIVLEILPTLKPGVVVHFHDIFLPWPYPREWLTRSRRFWAEQYLLQAFLAFNDSFKPLLATHALSREQAGRLGNAIPSFNETVHPGAFWLRREASHTSGSGAG
jgi:hypothetical protein